MSEQQTPTPREGEVPVPDKGGWVDGEGGPGFGGPPPEPPVEPPITREGGQEPTRDAPKSPSGPRKAT